MPSCSARTSARRPSARTSHRWRIAALAASAAALGLPAAASAHGGSTIAEGQRDGVTVLVQGSASTTASGNPAADLATTLDGPGTGPGASVVYWIRPEGGDTVRVNTERDESGVRHADVATAGRGDWRAWDVSAVVTLSDGTRLRVSNAEQPPGPDPSRASGSAQDDGAQPTDAPGADEGPTTPTAGERETPAPGVAAADDAGADAQPAVADISGDEDAAPAWVLPSIIGIALVGVLATLLLRRRRDA